MSAKVGVTVSEMMALREQGLSNTDIANVLEISKATVFRYIGKQGGRMESMAAFKEKPKAPPPVETPEIKRAVDEVIVQTEYICNRSGSVKATVDYIEHTVALDVRAMTFDELAEFATFVIGMTERIKGVKK